MLAGPFRASGDHFRPSNAPAPTGVDALSSLSRWDAAMGPRLVDHLHDPYGGLYAESRTQRAVSGGAAPLAKLVKSI